MDHERALAADGECWTGIICSQETIILANDGEGIAAGDDEVGVAVESEGANAEVALHFVPSTRKLTQVTR